MATPFPADVRFVEAQEVAQTHGAVGVAAPDAEDLPQRLVLHFLPGGSTGEWFVV